MTVPCRRTVPGSQRRPLGLIEAAQTKEAQRRTRKAAKSGSDDATDTPLLDRADDEAEADNV
jgi:hypothetical protein